MENPPRLLGGRGEIRPAVGEVYCTVAHPVTKLTAPLPLLEALRVVHWWELFTADGERWLHLSVLLDQVDAFNEILSLDFKHFE